MTTYYVGETQKFRHTEYDVLGHALAPQSGRWASTNPVVASVDQGGLATWLAAGETDLTFVVGDYRKAAIFHAVVYAAIPATLAASPATVNVYPGSIARVTITATDSGGHPVTDFSIDTIVTSDAAVATAFQLDAKSYLVLGIAAGGCQITVFAGPISAQFNVDVLASGAGISEGDADARYRQLAVTIPDSQVTKALAVEHLNVSGALAIPWALAARSHHLTLAGDIALTISAIAVNDFMFLDIETQAGNHALTIALSGLPPLVDDDNLLPSFSQAANVQESFMLWNQGERVILAKTYQAVPTS